MSEENGLTINIKKTKFMKMTESQQRQDNLWIKGKLGENVSKYRYLETVVNDNNEYTEEIRIRIV